MAKKLLTSVIALAISSLLSIQGWAATSNPTFVVTPPQPKWVELSTQQKTVLAPLAADWDSMEGYRRKKWIGIAQRFHAITGDEQVRIQRQMQEWAKLTPEQRRVAREKFQSVSQLPTEKKQELKQKWEEYSSLPEEERQKLQQQAVSLPQPKPGRPTAAGVTPATTVVVPAVPPASAEPHAVSGSSASPDTEGVPRP